jgi:hypothetical protein
MFTGIKLASGFMKTDRHLETSLDGHRHCNIACLFSITEGRSKDRNEIAKEGREIYERDCFGKRSNHEKAPVPGE